MPVSTKGNWPRLAIGGLILLNLVLLAALVLREPPGARTAEPVQSPTASSDAAPSATPVAAEPEPTPMADLPENSSPPRPRPPAKDLVRSTRVLAVSSDTLAWRATFGPCPTAPDLEVTRDGGRTWTRTSAGLRSVSRLRSYDETSAFAVGGAEDCQTRYVATGGPADSWGANEGLLRRTWYRTPLQPHRIHGPSGRVSTPCGRQLGDFAGLGVANAAALCADGTLKTTVTGGRAWRELDAGENGLALGADEGSYAVALRVPGCRRGLGVTVLEPGAGRVRTEEVRCAPVGRVDAGALAVALRGRVVWLWVGDRTFVSTDGGQEWSQARP